MLLNVGKMRDRIVVKEKVSDVIDTNTVIEYPEIMTVWGCVQPTSGRKFYEAWGVNAEKLVTVIIRYNAAVKANCGLKFGGVDYRIVSVVDTENRHKYMEIKCEALCDG